MYHYICCVPSSCYHTSCVDCLHSARCLWWVATWAVEPSTATTFHLSS
jgi:hypothetical protein